MVKVESKKTEIKRNVEFVFDYMKNFSNFSLMANDKIQNFKATEDKCSFTVNGMGDCGLKMLSRVPYDKIVITNDTDIQSSMPFNFILSLDFEKTEPYKCNVQATIELDVPQIAAMMIKKQLEKALNTLMDGLKERMEMIM